MYRMKQDYILGSTSNFVRSLTQDGHATLLPNFLVENEGLNQGLTFIEFDISYQFKTVFVEFDELYIS